MKLQAILCFIFGHRWLSTHYEQCPVEYLHCQRCGENYHACNEIDWSKVR